MGINTNIDGISKTVDTPSVNIGGAWKTVSTVCNNIDGVWKQSYPDAYVINLYIYGELYDTLYVTKGSKITLPSVDTVYEDETEHYGWTTTSGATSRNYAATASITPTADMDLYAVFSYTYTSDTLSYNEGATAYGQSDTVKWRSTVSGTCYIKAGYWKQGTPYAISIPHTYCYVKKNSTNISGTCGSGALVVPPEVAGSQYITVSASKGDVFTLYADYVRPTVSTSTTYPSIYICAIYYPTYEKTGYRSTI